MHRCETEEDIKKAIDQVVKVVKNYVLVTSDKDKEKKEKEKKDKEKKDKK